MEVWGLIISILALLASAFTYFKHDKKLKEQERKINEYQLKQIEKEDLESKKAAIRGNIVKGLRVRGRLRFTIAVVRLPVILELKGWT